MEWAWSGLTGQGSGLTGQAKALACQAGLTGRLAYGSPDETSHRALHFGANFIFSAFPNLSYV